MLDVLLMLKRTSFGEGLIRLLDQSEFGIVKIQTQYQNIVQYSQLEQPRVILFEVPQSGFPSVYGCLHLIDKIKLVSPESKILLMCSEFDQDAIQSTIYAKKNSRVDDFVFYDTSIEYLKASIKSLC